MDIEPTDPNSDQATEVQTSAAKALVRRFLVVLGITLVVGLILTWIENRMEKSETPDIIL